MSKKTSTFEDSEIYPPLVSGDGNNAYYHRCDVVEQETPYAGCLRRITQRKTGPLESMYAGCSIAINNGRCRAVDMRQEEMLQGRAIYFVNRRKQIDFYTAGQQIIATTQTNWKIPVKSSPVRPQHTVAPVQSDYAAAINQAINKTAQPAKTVVSPIINRSIPKGLSPREIAQFLRSNA